MWLAISDMTLMCEGNIEVGTVVMCFAAKDGQSGVQDCWRICGRCQVNIYKLL